MTSETNSILPIRQGYNRIAKEYRNWYWYPFWRTNEGPIIKQWLSSQSGVGLDAGCGNAPYLNDFCSKAKSRILIDISEGMLEQAKERVKKESILSPKYSNNLSLIQSDLNFLPIINDSIDFILCSRVLSNNKDYRMVLKEFVRVLKTSGEILISDIHPLHSYQYTGIDLNKQRINIETYKHSIQEIVNFSISLNLKLVSFNEYTLIDLIKMPDPEKFKKLYLKPKVPIFFVLIFSK